MKRIQVKPEALPGRELDEPVHPELGRLFVRAVLDNYKSRVPSPLRPRGWRRAVERGAQRMVSMCSRLDLAPSLPGVYPFGKGDAVVVLCSWGGLPARVPGVVLWGPGVLFKRVWVRVSGFGMVPAARVRPKPVKISIRRGLSGKTPPPPGLVEEGCRAELALCPAAG